MTGRGPGNRAVDFLKGHQALACVLLCLLVAASLIGLFAFVVFSDFSGSADFVYTGF